MNSIGIFKDIFLSSGNLRKGVIFGKRYEFYRNILVISGDIPPVSRKQSQIQGKIKLKLLSLTPEPQTNLWKDTKNC